MATSINIKQGWNELVRITYQADRVTEVRAVSNLTDADVAHVIARAMVSFAEAVSVSAGEQAHSEVAQLREANANAETFAIHMAMMMSEINANIKAPNIDIDVGDWTPDAGGN